MGKLIRDDLAMEMVKQIITNLEIDRSFIIRNVTDLARNAIRSEAQDRVDPNKLRQQIDSIQDKKIAALDSFLSGLITKDEFQQSKSRYDAQLGVLRDKIRKTNDTDHSAHFPGICEINKEVKLIMSCANAPESFLRFYWNILSYTVTEPRRSNSGNCPVNGISNCIKRDQTVAARRTNLKFANMEVVFFVDLW